MSNDDDVLETKPVSDGIKMKVSVLYSIALQEMPLIPINLQSRLPQVRERLSKHVNLLQTDKVFNEPISAFQKLLFLHRTASNAGDLPKRNFLYVYRTLVDEKTRIHKLFAGIDLCRDFGVTEVTRLRWMEEAMTYVLKKNEEQEKEAVAMMHRNKKEEEEAAKKKKTAREQAISKKQAKTSKIRKSSSPKKSSKKKEQTKKRKRYLPLMMTTKRYVVFLDLFI